MSSNETQKQIQEALELMQNPDVFLAREVDMLLDLIHHDINTP